MWNHILLKLIHCFLITYKTEHLVCLLLFIVSLYVKCLFMSFANFLFLFLIFVANISSWLFSCHCLWRVVCYLVICIIVSQVVQWSRICISMQETQVLSLGWEDPLEKEMATHSSILAWEIPWMKSLAGHSPWGCKESDTAEQLTCSCSPQKRQFKKTNHDRGRMIFEIIGAAGYWVEKGLGKGTLRTLKISLWTVNFKDWQKFSNLI